MKPKKKIRDLDFSSEKQAEQKKMRSFIIAFVSFVVILGTISVFVFMKSVDFNLNNLVQSTTDSAASTFDSTVASSADLSGRAGILLVFTDDSGSLISVSALDCNMDIKCISVVQLPADTSVSSGSLKDIYQKGGAAALEKPISDLSGLSFTKYIKMSQSQLKKVISKIGEVTVRIPSDINYKGADFSLLLDAGDQNLTSDLFCKYFLYADNSGRRDAAVSLLNTLMTAKNIPSQDTLFNFIMNNTDTDISVVDYSKVSSVLTSFVQETSGNVASAANEFPEVTKENEK